MKYFFSTGEPSGEAMAIFLAEEIRKLDPDAQFEGIGSARMRAAHFALWRDHTGWASMGPLAAIPRIPKLLNAMLRTAFHIVASKPDLVVLVDFGVFNLRLANTLRRLHYSGPIMDLFPPGTWLDNPDKARNVSAVAVPVTAFAHQYGFIEALASVSNISGIRSRAGIGCEVDAPRRRPTGASLRCFPAAARASFAATFRFSRLHIVL